MKFDVYGRFIVDVIRGGGGWEAYRVEQGKRIRLRDIVIPAEMSIDQIPCFLEDLWHESASPGKTIRSLE
jgi:hypothetical protein